MIWNLGGGRGFALGLGIGFGEMALRDGKRCSRGHLSPIVATEEIWITICGVLGF